MPDMSQWLLNKKPFCMLHVCRLARGTANSAQPHARFEEIVCAGELELQQAAPIQISHFGIILFPLQKCSSKVVKFYYYIVFEIF